MRGDSEEAGSLTEDHDSDSSPAAAGKAVSSNASSSELSQAVCALCGFSSNCLHRVEEL